MFEQLRLFSFKSRSSVKRVNEPEEREVISYKDLNFVVERAPRKRLSVQSKTNGHIKVSASKSLSRSIIIEFIAENYPWIADHQREMDKIRQKYPPKRFIHGEHFPFLGKEYPVLFQVVSGNKKFEMGFVGNQLVLDVPQKYLQGPEIKREYHDLALEKVKDFYKNAARVFILPRIDQLGNQMQLKPQKVSLRNQKTMWGSCSSAGAISINWKLMVAPKEVIDYVLIHELAHLRHQNHSKAFWSLVSKYSPDYDSHRKWLRGNQFTCDFLAKQSELYHPES